MKITFPVALMELCHTILNEGVEKLGMPVGIVSHIYNGVYEIVAINSDKAAFVEGEIFPLQSTYCRDVYTSGNTIAITEIGGTPGMRQHPLYVTMPLEAYISSPIKHNDKIWGTVNFTSTKIRKRFIPAEIKLVEEYADKLAAMLDDMMY